MSLLNIKNIALLCAAGALAIPSSASAAYPKPTDPFCDDAHPTVCMVTQDTDRYTQTLNGSYQVWWHPTTNSYSWHLDGCMYTFESKALWQQYGSPMGATTCAKFYGTYVTHQFSRFLYEVPEQDRSSFQPLMIGYQMKVHVDGLTSVDFGKAIYVAADNDGTSHLSGYCLFYTGTNEYGSYDNRVALDRTPSDIYRDCGFLRRESDAPPVTVAPPVSDPTVDTPDEGMIPRNAGRCGRVGVRGTGAVVIRNIRIRCGAARLLVARFVKFKHDPAGWICVSMENETTTTAKCVRAARSNGRMARTTIYGAWITRE